MNSLTKLDFGLVITRSSHQNRLANLPHHALVTYILGGDVKITENDQAKPLWIY